MNFSDQSPAAAHHSEAAAHFQNGDTAEAFRSLMAGFRADADHRPLYTLAADILQQAGGEEERALFANAATDFNRFEPFFELGYHFIDVGNPDLARPFLEKAFALNPEDAATAFELSLTMSFQIPQAIELLEQVEHLSDFWVVYRLFFLRLLNGMPEGLAEFIEDAREQVAEEPPEDEMETAVIWEKLLELEECLIRYDLLENPERHIRDWQFIQYGGAVLDYFDDAETTALEVAGGRYVGAFGSNDDIRRVLEKLRRFLTTLERLPDRVYGMEDRDSEIIGRTIASLLGKEFRTFSEGEETSNALVVAADNSAFNGFTDLFTVRPGQTVFAFNLNWLQHGMIAPDVTGLMSQFYTFPWNGGVMGGIDDENQIVRSAPDERSPQEIAADLVQIAPGELEGFDALLDFYSDLRDFLKGGPNGGEGRWGFVRDSPVPGNYFI